MALDQAFYSAFYLTEYAGTLVQSQIILNALSYYSHCTLQTFQRENIVAFLRNPCLQQSLSLGLLVGTAAAAPRYVRHGLGIKTTNMFMLAGVTTAAITWEGCMFRRRESKSDTLKIAIEEQKNKLQKRRLSSDEPLVSQIDFEEKKDDSSKVPS